LKIFVLFTLLFVYLSCYAMAEILLKNVITMNSAKHIIISTSCNGVKLR